MKLLLDTCTFLWWIDETEKLSKECRLACADANNDVYLSAASTWEISLKYSMKRLSLSEPPERYIPHYRRLHGIASLDVSETDTFHLPRLPWLHRDPFDRMLICQAIAQGLTIVTPDPLVCQYPIRTLW